MYSLITYINTHARTDDTHTDIYVYTYVGVCIENWKKIRFPV